jgi:general secretion pathway protein M
MQRLPTGRTGQALALLLLACTAAVIWLGVAAPLLDWHAERADALERRVALARRMAQVAASLPTLEQQEKAAAQSGPAPVAVLDGTSDPVAAAALSQTLQAIAARVGASLASTEVLPAEPRGAYRRIAVRATVTAPYPVLAGLLRSIEEASPRLLADDLQVIGNRGVIRDAAAPLQASLVVMGFRAGP